jgi:hypothetical protein
MGMLIDIVVADPADAPRVGASTCPSREFTGVEAKGIDTVKLTKLHSVLTGRPFDPKFIGNDALRFDASEDGPWVFEVPADLVGQLAQLGAGELTSVANEWSKIEEFSAKYDNWPAAAVHEMLIGLMVLCRKAVAENKVLFMWMSL